MKLIGDPDSLTKYPEVEALLAAGEIGGGTDAMDEDDWEKDDDAGERFFMFNCQ